MPVNPATIEQQVNALIDQTKVLSPEKSQQAFASGLANIIVTAIKSATVNPGIPVTTTGGSGATNGPGSLS